MNEFSIELASEKIVDHKTRDYFVEVLRSFISGNYRSAVVMLWAVVIADLVYKLQTLRNLYQDDTATAILELIETKQKANPSSPDWELCLLEEINKRTHLLEIVDYHHLLHLQKIRHLSAHPVLSSANLLFSPNKETVRSLIRNALEAVLLKPPIFSKKIVAEFVTDIAAKKDLLPDQKGLKLYIEAKYFQNLSPPVEHELIKALWKFCFRLSNEDTEVNREINTRCLNLLYQRNPIDFRRLVAQESDYFSEISPNDAPLSELIRFLSACPALYSALNDAAKVLLTAHAESDANLFTAALFLSDSFATHFSRLKTFDYKLLIKLSCVNWNDLIVQARENNQLQEVFDLGTFMYINSGSFNLADSNFEKFIDKYVDEFDKERLLALLKGIEENNQTSCRGNTWTDHPKIAERVEAVGGIDLADYPKFTRSLPTDK